MKRFAALFRALDESNRTGDKVAAVAAYLREAPDADAAWAIHFLIGKRPKRPINRTKLSEWARESSELPAWLFDECYEAVGDLAETLALLVPDGGERNRADRPLHEYVEKYILGLLGAEEDRQKSEILAVWQELDFAERFVFNKLITGAFRVGVSQELVGRAISEVSDVPKAMIAHRLMGESDATPRFLRALYSPEPGGFDVGQPYPFCLAYPLEVEPETLGNDADWCAEWKWDGIRAQVIRRGDSVAIWSRGEELMTERFPELAEVASRLPEGTVIDGECLAWGEGKPKNFHTLQRRLGRKTVSKRLQSEVPVVLVAFDLLEIRGRDIREEPLSVRRQMLDECLLAISPATILEVQGDPVLPDARLSLRQIEPHLFVVSPLAASWEVLREFRSSSRDLDTEGLMIKRWDSAYRVGRKKGDWWKWKIDPMTVDAVLLYAQRGSGKRASLYTDYTFAVWDGEPRNGGNLVPFAKAYSGLTDEEIRKVDAFVRGNTLKRFGPVRSISPELVFELAFEDIALSKRHKSGIAVRFPRILRWRTDKGPETADTLETIQSMIRAEEISGE